MDFWNEWDAKKAKIQNQSIGPRNSFEEQIEWTKKGKMWAYPIDNEYLFGPEHEVGFKYFFIKNYNFFRLILWIMYFWSRIGSNIKFLYQNPWNILWN